jgi:hypothetical protein
MSLPLCFSQIVGFSRKDDSCFDHGANSDWDASYAVSLSGLYLDELPGLPDRFIASLGGKYDLWEKMTNALENAIGTFKIDVLGEILKYMEPSRSRFKGNIGNKSFTTLLHPYSLRGLRMYSDIIGGMFILRGVSFILDTTGPVDFAVLDENGNVLYNGTLNATAGKVTYNAITPLSIPLDGNYYFIYDAAATPYNNKLTCNCGGFKWCFNVHTPCFGRSRDNWTEWAMFAGVYTDTNPDMDDWPLSMDAQGMILHGDFTCDIFGSLCSDHSDWTGNEIDFAIANAIWYKTGEYLATYIMDTEEVSRKTLLGVEQWNANRAFYNARYVTLINFIAENFEADRNECLRCRPPMGYKKRVQML